MKVRAHIRVSGRVQGVFFRFETKREADKHGVKGWVTNHPDGSVEAVFEGEERLVKEMIDWCHQGPSLAKVEKVEIKNQKSTNEFDSFSIKY